MHADVVLVNMPFSSLLRPSLALSLLKAELQAAGFTSKVLYPGFALARKIGAERYILLANQTPQPSDLVGEWIFSSTLFEDAPIVPYLQSVLLREAPVYRTGLCAYKDPGEVIRIALAARMVVGSFLTWCEQQVLQWNPKIIGFTSVFQQHVASLALARRIKSRAPEISIVFGGDNCEGVMGAEIIRSFPFVDAVVSGEGDLVFPQLVDRLLNDIAISDLPGVYTKVNVDAMFRSGMFVNSAPVSDMDSLPAPDFSDFFEQFCEAGLDPKLEPQLLMETSRGCWWGEKNHCTFCGLSNALIQHRSKSPSRAVEELEELISRYPVRTITMTDKILGMQYFQDFLPQLAEKKLDATIFYEVKANLTKRQVKLLRDAGVRQIQPGIESFSDSVLRLMAKGVRGLQNIQLLKWCKEYGIQAYWNILWGFPHEDPDEYRRMIDLIPKLTHLPRPESAGHIRLDRFSPHFESADQFGFINVTPYPAYFFFYPFETERVANLAYYFTYDYAEPRSVRDYVLPLWNELSAWWSTQRETDLFYLQTGEQLLIWDFRPIAVDPLTVVTEPELTLYTACDSIQTLEQLRRLSGLPAGEVEQLAQPFVDRGLMLREGNSFLSLAIPLGEYSPPPAVLNKFLRFLTKAGILLPDGFMLPLETLSA